jgi:peptidoglycan hydrolase CwlO-like protein
MTPLEIILILVVIIAVVIAIYFFFKGKQGKISLTRPMESRVDEYLDRRFESMVTEWALVRTPAVKRFKEQHGPVLDQDEAKVSELQSFEKEINNSLSRMDDRLDNLEKELSKTGAN